MVRESGVRARILRRIPAGRLPTLATNGLLLLGGIVTSVIVSRALGPEGRGEYVSWQSWAATIGVLTLCGLPQVLVLDTWTPGRHKLGELVVPLAWSLAAAVVALVGLAALLGHSQAVAVGAVLAAATTQFGAVGAAEAQRMGRMGLEFNIARLMPQLASLTTMAGLLATSTRSATTWLIAISGIQTVTTAAWMVGTTERLRTARVPARRVLVDSLRLGPGNWITLAQYRFDLLTVATLFPPAVVAYYAVGVAAQSAVLAAGQSGGMHWFARRSGADGTRRPQLHREVWKTIAVAATVAAPIAATSPFWVPHLYGSAFASAVPVVAVLCCVGVVQSVDYLLAHACLASAKGRRILWYRLPSVVLLAAGFCLARAGGWPMWAIAILPGLGYGMASVAFTLATRSRRDIPPSPPDRKPDTGTRGGNRSGLTNRPEQPGDEHVTQ